MNVVSCDINRILKSTNVVCDARVLKKLSLRGAMQRSVVEQYDAIRSSPAKIAVLFPSHLSEEARHLDYVAGQLCETDAAQWIAC